jgi:vacuolar-type H+-ATPase subunit E/Vma4
MIQELTESVDQLRDEAQVARKAARQSADPAKREQLFASAREKFESAIRRLERGLRNVRRDQKEHSSDACAVLERLSQTYGSLGGTLRDFALTKADPERKKMLAEARSQYEQGNTYGTSAGNIAVRLIRITCCSCWWWSYLGMRR